MTEHSIETLISLAFMCVFYYFLFRFISGGFNKPSNPQQTEDSNNYKHTQKSVWDKWSIVAKVVASIGALIYAIVQLIKILK